MSKKPSDLPTHLEVVKATVRRDPVLNSCEEVRKAYEYFLDAGFREGAALHLTAIAIDNLWEEDQ